MDQTNDLLDPRLERHLESSSMFQTTVTFTAFLILCACQDVEAPFLIRPNPFQVRLQAMDVWTWMAELVTVYGYLGAFVVCTISNFSIFIPIPFAFIVYAFGSTLNPLLLGIVSGLGSTIGEMVSYILGRGGRKIIEGKYGSRLDAVEKLIDRYGTLSIFIFALLPLPDDLLLIPLGMMKYDIKKTFIVMLLGKTLICIFLAYAGAFSFSYLRDLFIAGGAVGGMASIVLLVIVIIVMIRIDWAKVLEDRVHVSREK